jgi:hypothetical protein
MRSGTKVTDRARAKFLERLRESPNISAAARCGGFSRTQAYRMREADAKFAAEWDEAIEESIDALEQTAWERAGLSSDRLTEVLLKAHRPDKYVEKRLLEHTGKDGGPVQIAKVVHEVIDPASPDAG